MWVTRSLGCLTSFNRWLYFVVFLWSWDVHQLGLGCARHSSHSFAQMRSISNNVEQSWGNMPRRAFSRPNNSVTVLQLFDVSHTIDFIHLTVQKKAVALFLCFVHRKQKQRIMWKATGKMVWHRPKALAFSLLYCTSKAVYYFENYSNNKKRGVWHEFVLNIKFDSLDVGIGTYKSIIWKVWSPNPLWLVSYSKSWCNWHQENTLAIYTGKVRTKTHVFLCNPIKMQPRKRRAAF